MTTEKQSKELFAGWVDLQILGHIHHIGYLQEVQRFGVTLLHIEPLTPAGTLGKPIEYGAGSLFALAEMTEEEARTIIAERQERTARRQQLLAAPRPVLVEEEPFDEDLAGDDDFR